MRRCRISLETGVLNSLIRTLKSHKILQFFSFIDGLKNASLWREAMCV